jgi:hypothetical protein
MTRQSEFTWKFFKKDVATGRAICLLCTKTGIKESDASYAINTQAMFYHVTRVHHQKYEDVDATDGSCPPAAKRARQQLLICPPDDHWTKTQRIALAFVMNGDAYRHVEDEFFEAAFWESLSKCVPPVTRKDLSAAVRGLHAITKDFAVKLLQDKSVTLALDSWTNVCHEKIVNFVCLAPPVRVFWCSKDCDLDSATADYLASMISSVAADVEQADIRVVGIVSDNARNMTNGVDLVCSRPPHFFFPIRCAAHGVNLVMKDLLDRKGPGPLAASFEFMEQVVASFQGSQDLRRALLEHQEHLGLHKPLKLIKPSETRWNSQLRAMIRIEKLQEYVKLALSQSDQQWVRDDLQWKKLKEAIQVLKPFQIALDTVQKDKATCLGAWKAIECLRQDLGKLEKEFPCLKKITTEAWAKVFGRWATNFDCSLACAAGYLLDPSDRKHWDVQLPGDELNKAVMAICDFGSRYILRRSGILKYVAPAFGENDTKAVTNVVVEPPELLEKLATLRLELEKQLGQYVLHCAPFDDEPRQAECASEYWYRKVFVARELATAAIAVLGLCPTESSVERSFGEQSLVHTPLRNSLSEENVEAEVFLRQNFHLAFPDDPAVRKRAERLVEPDELVG